jgi:hypothetical protein
MCPVTIFIRPRTPLPVEVNQPLQKSQQDVFINFGMSLHIDNWPILGLGEVGLEIALPDLSH